MKSLAISVGLLSLLAVGFQRSTEQARVAAPIPAKDAGIGLVQSKLNGTDLNGKSVTIPAPGAKFTVVALTSTTCPLCKKYGPTLAAIEQSYSKKGVSFVFVNPSLDDPVKDQKARAKRLGLKGSYVFDKSHAWIKSLGAETTTEVFLLDPKGKILYRGAVDDQFSIGASLPKPRNKFLANALDSALAGKKIAVPATNAPGCLLAEIKVEIPQMPAYHGNIQHIVQKNCLSCHRDEGVAPFALDNYEAVKFRAKMIQFVLKDGIMPPWFAEKGSGPWKNDGSISDQDKKTIDAWVSAGMPKGDPASAPKPLQFSGGWSIGKPDAIFQLPNPVKINASGIMEYENINVPTNFTEDKWVEKIEVIPGDRRAVHHVLVFARNPGSRGRGQVDETLDEISGFFGAYVPGNSALSYGEGRAKRIPKGSILRFQIHYTPFGEETTDQTKIGLVFAKTPVKNEVHTTSLANLMFSIPPGAPNHEVKAELKVPMDVQILSYLPHMHVRGKAANYELTRDGKKTTLLNVPKYDFNWQLNYILQNPLDIKKGDTITYRAWFDNSDKNPANPDPKKTVRWGSQTFDEMHLGYIEYIIPGEKPGEGSGGIRRGSGLGGAVSQIENIFSRLDRNGDGKLSQSEAGLFWNRIKEGDKDGDGLLSLDEVLDFLASNPGQNRESRRSIRARLGF